MDVYGFRTGYQSCLKAMLSGRTGAILIDEETAKRSKGFFEMRELGKRHFKNIKTPIRVFTLGENSP